MAPILRLDGVTKRYGEVLALDAVDLAVEPGQIVALLGSNGAGKSTLFELLLGLVHPTAGQVEVHGRAPGSRGARTRTGAMLQTAGLPEQVTVRELVDLVGATYLRASNVDEVLARTALQERARRQVTALSGGERQRLLLACALIGAPPLLLLDEPTAGMDVNARRLFWNQVEDAVVEGSTVLFATHDLREADAVARRVVVLRRGRLIADTTPSGLKELVSPKVLRVLTTAPVSFFAGRPEVDHADDQTTPPDRARGLQRLRVHGREPEQVVAAVIAGGFRIEDLVVADAELEEAFVRLTEASDDPVTVGEGRP